LSFSSTNDVSVQLLAQQSQMGLVDHSVIQFTSINKDRICGNWLWDQEFQITQAVRSHNFGRSFFSRFCLHNWRGDSTTDAKRFFQPKKFGRFCL